MSLPNQIPTQSVPIAEKGADGNLYVSINWYLFLYSLGKQLFGSESSSGGDPVQPPDLIDMTDLDAALSDIPPAYRRLTNLHAIESIDVDLAAIESAELQRRDVIVQMLLQELDAGPSLRDLANAILLGSDAVLPDPIPAARPAQTVTPSASPFIYTAATNGVLSTTGGTVSAIAIVRQGVSVATGITAGLVPVRRSDQVQITYSSAPIIAFLPD